jgi:hypothetical protein
MANTLRIKRRASGGSGAPTSLQNAELAFNEVDNVLYYGKGTGGSGGSATTVEAIAGSGAYLALTGAQTVAGVKTFSDTISGSITGNAGTATTLATARDLSLTGDATATLSSFNGSANVSAALTLATVNSNVGTFTKLTVNGKGLVTAAANAILNDIGAPTSAYSFNSQRITNLAEPSASTDAATKNYVDSVAQGLDVKASVVAATTADITLTAPQTIDGISVIAGDRVLVKNQATSSQNGIYLVAAGAWTRAADADTWNELVSAFVFVERGTVNADVGFVCTVDPGGTLNSTSVTFTQFSGAGSYAAGNGLTLTGNTFDVVGTANRISVAADSVDIASTYVGQTSITTLGTIGTGTWNGSTIGIAYGGIGLTTAVNGLLKGNGTAYSVAVAGTDYLDPNSTIDGGTF